MRADKAVCGGCGTRGTASPHKCRTCIKSAFALLIAVYLHHADWHPAMGETNKLFHAAIGRACGNSHVERWYESLLNSSMRLARAAYEQVPLHGSAYKDYYARVDAEHRSMVEAIRRRDAQAAEQLARDHTTLFRER